MHIFKKKDEQKRKAEQKYNDWLKEVAKKQTKDAKQKEKLKKVRAKEIKLY